LPIICDGSFAKLRTIFVQAGVPVSLVCQSSNKNAIFIQLLDSSNEFKPELV
jgi:hypothetical protein